MMLPEGSVIGGFISKVINDVVDISKYKIKEADKNRKSKSQNIQTRIYQVIIDAINELTFNRYKGQDKLYDTAEILLNELKSGNNDLIEHIRDSLRNLSSLIDYDTCERFIEILRCEIEKEENFDLYKEILLVLLEDATKYTQSELQQIKLQLEEINEKLNGNVKNRENQSVGMCQNIKSRTQEYADKWNANMFLNDFDEWDENAGVNVKLSDIYLDQHLPHFIYGENKKESNDLKRFLAQYIKKSNENKMLLILGHPGIGKSTLLTWITANFDNRFDDILIYQFARDLKNIKWERPDLSIQILESLNLSYSNLEGKILIFDGYDEISIRDDERKEILDELYWKLINGNNVNGFSLIITCRINYIQNYERVKCKYITLSSWDEIQIRSFCKVFQKKTKVDISKYTQKSLYDNKEILGIPLVLYMVLALNIDLEKGGSIVDVYDKIFSLDGGIYDRCINNKSFADVHRISQIKELIHQITREIAIWIFENNSDEAYIPQAEYQKICHDTMMNCMNEEEDIEQDFLIGNFFKLKYCEGKEGKQIYFVHRSIYEYFVAETIYSSIEKPMENLSLESQEDLAKSIAVFLKQGKITFTIGEYLKYKIIRLYSTLSAENKEIFYQWWESTVAKMVENGMLYYTNIKRSSYINIFNKECRCFMNIIKILKLISFTNKEKNILKEVDKNKLEKYIKHCLIEEMEPDKRRKWMSDKELQEIFNGKLYMESSIDFSKMYLSEMDFSGLDLQGINLSEANLSKANLNRTYLCRANLKRANLEEISLEQSNLSKAYLGHANLKGANLKNANLSSVNLVGANFDGINLRGANLSEVNFNSINLNGIDMRYAILRKAKLDFSYLSKTNLENAILSQANLYKAILHGTNLYKAVLLRANLREADLKKADLKEADLRGANLIGADLRGADLLFAKFDENQISYLADCDLFKSLVYVEKYDRFIDYLEYQEMKEVIE